MTRFLPEYRTPDIEARVENVLREAQYHTSHRTDVEAIAERYFDLTLFFGRPEDIGQPKYVLGAVFFEEKEIFINEILVGNEGRFRFTLAHELGHWVLHRDIVDPIVFAWPFVPGKANQGRQILCRSSDFSPVESQANIFAACLLMPRWTFSNRVHELASQFQLERGQTGYLASEPDYDRIIRQLSSEFGVSREATRYRLRELRLMSVGTPGQLRLLL